MAQSASVSMLPIDESAVVQTKAQFTEGVTLVIQQGSPVLYNLDSTYSEEFQLKTITVENTHIYLYFEVRPDRERKMLTIEVLPTASVADVPAINIIRVKQG